MVIGNLQFKGGLRRRHAGKLQTTDLKEERTKARDAEGAQGKEWHKQQARAAVSGQLSAISRKRGASGVKLPSTACAGARILSCPGIDLDQKFLDGRRKVRQSVPPVELRGEANRGLKPG